MIYLGLAWGLLLVCLCPCTGYESKARHDTLKKER